jgi:uncharacterized phiE125 gp8 family phage protein
MSNELQVIGIADTNVYAVIRNAAAQVYQTTTQTFVTFVDANYANYDVALTEQGTSSGYYVGDFPTSITTAGTYYVVAYQRAGASPAISDTVLGTGEIVWDGSAEVATPSGDGLISLAYAKQFMKLTVSTYDDLLDDLIAAASDAVQSYARRRFAVANYAEYYNGDGTRSLLLKRYPVVALTQVTLNPYDDSEVIDGDEYIVDKPTGEIRPKLNSTGTSYFPCGFQTVLVEYSAGAAVPADVQAATAMVVANLYGSAGRDNTLASERIGDYAYTLRSATQSIVMTPEIRGLLDRYRDYSV